MNKAITLMFSVFFVGSSFAGNIKFTNGDGSAHADLCIAAVTSKVALKAKVKELGYSKSELTKFNCNGLALKKFAKKYNKSAISALNKPFKVFSFDNSVGSVEADICIAAARSNESFEMIKANLAKPKSYYKKIICNKMALDKFARRHGNKKFRI